MPDRMWLPVTGMDPRLLYSHPDRRQTSYFPQNNSPGTTENELALINTIQMLNLSLSLSYSLLTSVPLTKKVKNKCRNNTQCVQSHIELSNTGLQKNKLSFFQSTQVVEFSQYYEKCNIIVFIYSCSYFWICYFYKDAQFFKAILMNMIWWHINHPVSITVPLGWELVKDPGDKQYY